jgi:predicted RNase H-like HicB family nuclease
MLMEIEREDDGRWIGEVPSLPGVMAYGASEADARDKTAALALRVLADRLEHGEPVPPEARELFVCAWAGPPRTPAGLSGLSKEALGALGSPSQPRSTPPRRASGSPRRRRRREDASER